MNFEKLKDYVETICGRELASPTDNDLYSKLHVEYVNPVYLPPVARFAKFTQFSNKRKKDASFGDFEVLNGEQSDGLWGLTKPNEHAYYKGLSKFCKAQVVDYDEEAWAFASQAVEDHFFKYLKESGIESVAESIARLDIKKSPGPPWNFNFKTKEKLITDELFLKMCHDGWDQLLEADRVWLTGTALKEEVRPQEKIDANKVRLFNPQAADLNVLTNRLCGKFNDKFTECNMKTFSCVGMTPFYGGWNRLYKKLTPKDKPFMFEGDYSDYDSSLGVYLMMMVCKFRFKCLPDNEKTYDNWCRLCNLYRNIIFSLMVLKDGVIVQKPGGNPSGSANTVVDNTIIGFFMLAYAWARLCPPALKTYNSFVQNVIAALYGDDNTGAVSHIARAFYTPSKLTAVMAEMGMTLNFEHDDFVTIHDVSFLQADFNQVLYGTVIYHVTPNKSYESIKWSEHPKDPAISLARACGMRLVTWSDADARAYYARYIDFLLKRYDTLLAGTKEWDDAKSSYKSDWAMMALFTGFESKDQKDIQTSIREQQNFEFDFDTEEVFVKLQAQSRMLDARIERKLGRMVATGMVSQEAVEWLLQTMDGFSDEDREAVGYPDVSTTKSLVQLIQTTCQINVPGTLSTNYDAIVLFIPLTPDLSTNGPLYKPTTMTLNVPTTTFGVTQTMCGGWVCITGPPGFAFDPVAIPAATSCVVNTTCGIPVGPYQNSPTRIVSSSCEVYNTTAEIYKQGSVTVCSSSNAPRETYYISGTTAAVNFLAPCTTIPAPPQQTADIQLYPGSLTWDAAEGIYMNARVNNFDNPFFYPLASNCGMLFDASPDENFTGNGDGWFCQAIQTTTAAPATFSSCGILPFDVTICRFSGLSNNSTLTMTAKYVLESAPDNYSQTYIPLMRPASEYSSQVFDIYAQAIKHMPVACKVGENSLGSWFSQVLDVVNRYALPVSSAIGSALGNPLAGAAVGTGLKGVAMTLQGTPGMKAIAKQQARKAMIRNDGPVRKETILVVKKSKPKKPKKKVLVEVKKGRKPQLSTTKIRRKRK